MTPALLTALFLIGQPKAPSLRIENLSQPGAFELVVSAPASLATLAFVEKETASGWVPVARNIVLMKTCPDEMLQAPACIDVAAGDRLRPPPWTGYSCGGQCNGHCKKNVYEGPGTFRFVVFVCDGHGRFEGPPFPFPAFTAGPAPARQ